MMKSEEVEQPSVKEKLSAMLKMSNPSAKIQTFSEEFILFFLANMLLVDRTDFLFLHCDKYGMNIEENPDLLNKMPTSKNFKGNVWRLTALFMLRESKD